MCGTDLQSLGKEKIMTFARLIELAQFGSAMDKYSTNVEYIDIHDFAKIWYKLAQVELDNITLIHLGEAEIVKRIMKEAKKACAECQEFNCDECVYREYRK